MSQFALTTAWTKVASAGSTVEVQNLSNAAVRIVGSAAIPAIGSDGEVLHNLDDYRKFEAPLPYDLYACALAGTGSIEVVPIGSDASGTGYAPSGAAIVSGSFSGTGQSATFAPVAGRAFNVSVAGTFVGFVQLERYINATIGWAPFVDGMYSLDNPLGVISETLSKQDDRAGAQYRLNCISYVSGTLNYQFDQ